MFMLNRDMHSIHLSWSGIVTEEHRRHPGMMAVDLYKLVAQACLGGDHLLHDHETFRKAFLEEWHQLRPVDAVRTSALQVIHPAGKVARLHLGTCRALGVAEEALLKLLLSQPMCEGRSESLAWSWASVLHCARRAEIPFDLPSLAQLGTTVGVPHHSVTYGPASYRLINDLRHVPTREALARLDLL